MTLANSIRWTTSSTLSLLVGTATLPLFFTEAANAQLLFRSTRQQYQAQFSTVTIPAGTTIPVRYEEAEKIVMAPEETIPLTLTVAANVRNSFGTVLIPYGSEVVGELRPVPGGGVQFIADELISEGSGRQFINATSGVVTRTETISRGASTGDILEGAAIGAAAAAVISGITGDRAIATEEVLGGAGLGAIGGLILGRDRVEVISIYPAEDLDITLQSDLSLRL